MFFIILLSFLGVGYGVRDPRIANGHPIEHGDAPYLVAIRLNSQGNWYFMSGGTLIAPNKVLTAAHCIIGSAANLGVVVGDYHTGLPDGTEEFIAVADYVSHPGYNGNSAGLPNDVAVITLAHNVNLTNSFVDIMPLPSDGQDFSGHNCTLTGWGSTSGQAVVENTPTSAFAPAISNPICAGLWISNDGTILDSHICMVGENGEVACHYDNGGPMVCDGVVAGIVSWGDGTCAGSLPSVMTRVTSYLSFINSNL